MLPSDWDAMSSELQHLRDKIANGIAYAKRHMVALPADIVPVVDKKQLIVGQSYVLLTGWYKQQCVIVRPEFTVADIKAYLHRKNGRRMPIEAQEIALRTGRAMRVLDDGWTLQRVYVESGREAFWQDELGKGDHEGDNAGDNAGGQQGDHELDHDADDQRDHEGRGHGFDVCGSRSEPSSNDKPSDEMPLNDQPSETLPRFLGKAMVLGVGKRIQDRQTQLWLKHVHDPYSFRTPDDDAPKGGTVDAARALPAPRGWSSPAETTPIVGSTDSCSIM